MEEVYRTIKAPIQGEYKEKKSKFIALAFPVSTLQEVKTQLDLLGRTYYDARHICWAYMLGEEYNEYRSNDDGEPSNTAGKPILNTLKKYHLTNILVAVVRYFGGVKLGTSGLIEAYTEATEAALVQANIEIRPIVRSLTVNCLFIELNHVMRVVKEESLTIVEQHFDTQCTVVLEVPRHRAEELSHRIDKLLGRAY